MLVADKALKEGVVQLGLKIWNLVSAPDEERDKRARELLSYLGRRAEEVSEMPQTTKGHHAAGHLAVAVKHAAHSAQGKLEEQFRSTRMTEYAKRLHGIFDALKDLETQGHEPWLRASWQIKYEAACHGAAESLARPLS